MTRKPTMLAVLAAGAVVAVGVFVTNTRVADDEATPLDATHRAAVPEFQPDPAWPPELPNNWVLGQVSSIAVDRRDHVWILHRPRIMSADKMNRPVAPPVLEFDATGKFVQGWGGPGPGYEWPENEHGIYVDDKDIVWIGGQAGTGSGMVKFKKT